MRQSFDIQFGRQATNLAFREIDSLILGEKEKSGKLHKFKAFFVGEKVQRSHLLRAQQAAMEFLTPLHKAQSDVQRAQLMVGHAKQVLSAAESELSKAETRKRELLLEKDEYQGEYVPRINDGLINLSREMPELTENVRAAKATLADAEQRLQTASSHLDSIDKAMKQEFGKGEDETQLKREIATADAGVQTATRELSTALSQFQAAEQNFKDAKASKAYYASPGSFAPGLQGDYDRANEALETAKTALGAAETKLSQAKTDASHARERFEAMRSGPQLRKFQTALDHVGNDPRFVTQLDGKAPGKLTDTGLLSSGWFEAKLAPSSLKEKGIGLIPLVGFGRQYYRAVKAEDRERRLKATAQHLDGYPVAKGLANAIGDGMERKKYALGIEATLTFVSTAVTMPGASAFGAVTAPVTSSIATGISAATSPLIAQGVASIPMTGAKTVASLAVGLGLDKHASKHATELEDQGVSARINTPLVPEGTSMPVITVKPYEPPSTIERTLPLSDPEVAVAFMAYLGPKSDDKALASDKLGEHEKRRLALREEFFGAKPNEDLAPGVTLQNESVLREALDGGRTAPSIPGGTSPLHLMMASLGMTKSA